MMKTPVVDIREILLHTRAGITVQEMIDLACITAIQHHCKVVFFHNRNKYTVDYYKLYECCNLENNDDEE
jgi:hypothetical protein